MAIIIRLSSAERLSTHILLFVMTALMSSVAGIHVDWNTNKGPIVPAVPTPRPIPQPPFRNPAPVWEEQNDIPNPNPYTYVAPPPSRPKYNNYEWQKAQNSLQWVQPTSGQVRQQTNYNQVLSLQSNGVDTHLVPAIAIKYVPNVGNQYYAVVPKYYKIVYVKNDEDIYQKYDKVNGKYNPKYKKYKNYEKVKYIPVQLNVPVQNQKFFYNKTS